jgi:hypothetical protein
MVETNNLGSVKYGGKNKDVSIHTLKASVGGTGLVLTIFNLSARWRNMVIFTPQQLYLC